MEEKDIPSLLLDHIDELRLHNIKLCSFCVELGLYRQNSRHIKMDWQDLQMEWQDLQMEWQHLTEQYNLLVGKYDHLKIVN